MSPQNLLLTQRGQATARSRSWQDRRAKLLQEACEHIAREIANGVRPMKAVRETARRFRNRSLGDGRSIRLSARSLYVIWREFKACGSSAFVLRYVAGKTREVDPFLKAFVVQSAVQNSKTVSEVLTEARMMHREGAPSLRTIYRSVPAKAIREYVRLERSLLARRAILESKRHEIDAWLLDLQQSATGAHSYRRKAA